MTDESQQAAPYPANNTEEIQAVVTFLKLLDLKHVKPHLNWLDRVPNTDGQVELVGDDQKPLGKIEVQVKKLPRDAISFQCPVALIHYSEQSLLPLLLVCVDVDNNKAYFRHLQRALMPDLRPGQDTFVVHFDPKIHSISFETQYVRQWAEILEERRRRISEYPRLSEIAARVDLSHISRVDRVYFQEYIENANRFLDMDFPAVKDQFFRGVWKLGVAVSSADPAHVYFEQYRILPGDTDIRVSAIAAPRPIQRHWVSRSFLRGPVQQAQDFVLRYVSDMIRAKSFPLVGKRLAKEYLFWFVDNFG